jgi:hypothetical protein
VWIMLRELATGPCRIGTSHRLGVEGVERIGQVAYLRGYKERGSGLCESAHLMRRRTNRITRRRSGELSESRGSLEDLRDHLDRQDHELVRLETVEADQS